MIIQMSYDIITWCPDGSDSSDGSDGSDSLDGSLLISNIFFRNKNSKFKCITSELKSSVYK